MKTQRDARMPKFLIVEDDKDQNLLTTLQLKRRGFSDLVPAYLGSEAIEKVKSDKYDLVLMDIMLPDITGYELIGEVREAAANSALPVIALTGCTMDEDIRMIREAGFSDLITKPVEVDLLVSKIKNLLG
jgi:DNA-binding response OmpR family regulator